MIVLASVLLVFSITANWVQLAVLDTDSVVDTTDEILRDKDVQDELSIYLVDQVYANVDVQGQIEDKLPDNALAADIIYTPLETPFLAAARARGNRTTNGLGMLLHQGRPAWKRWFGIETEVTPELRSLMERSLT